MQRYIRFSALASDYDGTLARQGTVPEEVTSSLERLAASGRKLLLVTGRELDDMLQVYPRAGIFSKIVAENGAVIYTPATGGVRLLAEAPPPRFFAALQTRAVQPLSHGRVIVSTWHPNEVAVLETIRDLGLELEIVFNKGAVMILPPCCNKASGLVAALEDLGLSAHNVVGAGDAENDTSFLSICECRAVVANALPALKEQADIVTASDHGPGVAELIGEIIENDLGRRSFKRGHVRIGADSSGAAVELDVAGPNVLVAGSSGAGKSTLASVYIEQLLALRYQLCVIDPEGDYEGLPGTLMLGSNKQAPSVEDVQRILERPGENLVLNFSSLSAAERPALFLAVLGLFDKLRAIYGRPHCIIVDEAHHVLPRAFHYDFRNEQHKLQQMLFVTVYPNQLHQSALDTVGVMIAVGAACPSVINEFARLTRRDPPKLDIAALAGGEAYAWHLAREASPLRMTIAPSSCPRRRHSGKYAEGQLPEDRSFYFRGPDGKLNLRAQNLILFVQIAEGVDDETWLFHLQQGDFAEWFRRGLKDETLAAEAERIAGLQEISAEESRRLLRTAIEEDYILPATGLV